jgi:hypothetical protein
MYFYEANIFGHKLMLCHPCQLEQKRFDKDINEAVYCVAATKLTMKESPDRYDEDDIRLIFNILKTTNPLYNAVNTFRETIVSFASLADVGEKINGKSNSN